MELLTNGGEHHEIGDEGWVVMTTASISPLRSPKWTPDLPSRGRTGCGGGSVSWNGMNSSPWFFSPRIGLYGVGVEVGGAPGGAPPPLWLGCGTLLLILSPIFFINSKTCLREVSGHSDNFYFCTKITPCHFYRKQRQSWLVPFKSCKLESKTRAKGFRKLDMLETYKLPQA